MLGLEGGILLLIGLPLMPRVSGILNRLRLRSDRCLLLGVLLLEGLLLWRAILEIALEIVLLLLLRASLLLELGRAGAPPVEVVTDLVRERSQSLVPRVDFGRLLQLLMCALPVLTTFEILSLVIELVPSKIFLGGLVLLIRLELGVLVEVLIV